MIDTLTAFAVNTTSAGNQINPDVVGLKDGGFVVVWQDEQRDGVYGQRFDAAGNTVGSEFLAGSGTASIGVPTSVALLGDGRFIVGFTEYFNNNYGYAYATIFDPRDSVINGDGNNNVITSRIDGATVNGLGGGDTLLGQGGPDTLNGGSGVDTMRGRGGDDTYIVDEQGDFPVESFNQGTDLVLSSVSYSLVDNVENLTLNGAAVSGGGNGIANVLTGNDGLNRLDGFDGNDTLIGKGGSDFLFGGNNDDTLLGEGESDDLEGNGGNDALDGGSGSDRMNGGAGIDTLTGGAGPDTFVFDACGDRQDDRRGRGQCRHRHRLQPGRRYDRAGGVGVPEAQGRRLEEQGIRQRQEEAGQGQAPRLLRREERRPLVRRERQEAKGQGRRADRHARPRPRPQGRRHRRGVSPVQTSGSGAS